MFGIHEGPEKGWTDILAFGPIAIGLIGLAAFVWWELRSENPLLDVTAFTNRGLASGSLTITLLFAVMFGIFLVLFPFLQTVLGWSAVLSATAMLPMAAAMMPMSTIAPRIAARIGHRTTMLTGLGVATVGLSTLALMASVEGGYLSILPGLMILGLGMGLTMTPSTEAITATLPAEKQGVASALNDTSRELGGAVGVALLGSLLTSGYSDRISSFASQLPGELGRFVGDDYFLALGAAQQAGQQDPSLAAQIVDAAQHAYVESWASTMWAGVAILVIAFVYVAVAGPKGRGLDTADRFHEVAIDDTSPIAETATTTV